MSNTYSKRHKQRTDRPWEDQKSFNEREWRACTGKTQYHSERMANQAIILMIEQVGGIWKSYKCEFCKKFHLTHSRLRDKKYIKNNSVQHEKS